MPIERVIHYNPPNRDDGKTRDGRRLAKVKWANNIDDVTCNRCLQLEGKSIR